MLFRSRRFVSYSETRLQRHRWFLQFWLLRHYAYRYTQPVTKSLVTGSRTCTKTIFTNNWRIRRHPLLEGSRITLPANRLSLYSSHGGLTWQHAPSTTAVCDASKLRLLVVIFLVIALPVLCRKAGSVPAFVCTNLSMTMGKWWSVPVGSSACSND